MRELARALSLLRHDVHVVTRPAPGHPSEASVDGYTVHRPRLSRAGPLFTAQLKRWLKKFVQREGVDVVHVHGVRPLEGSQGLAVPVVFTNHTSGFLQRVARGTSAQARVARRMTHLQHVLAPSEELCAATRKVGFTGPVDFIPNGVDIERFQPGDRFRARQALNIPNETTVVLLARRLVPKNGCRYFAESAAVFGGPRVQILIAGDGPDRGVVKNALSNAGALDQTTFLGNVDNDAMPEIYRAADISVLPSLQEATSITGLESMASGLPLVGTRVGGIPTLIDEGQSGLLVAARHPVALGEAIATLCDSPDERVAMGIHARQRAETQFAWPRIAERTASVYASVRRA